jgi:hypothetical protein
MLNKYFIHHPESIFKSVTVVNETKSKVRPPETKRENLKLIEYDDLYKYNYTKKMMVSIMSNLDIKIKKSNSMKKEDLLHNLYNTMRLKFCVLKIQKAWDLYFIKKYNECLGPTYRKFQKSNNVEDFLTVEAIKDIDYDFYMSFEDYDGFCYTFNIISLYNLRLKNMNDNPYNRNPFPNDFINLLNRKVLYNNILVKKHSDMMEKHREVAESFNQPLIDNRTRMTNDQYTSQIRDIFCTIDSLGNYTQAEWILQLNRQQIRRFIHELKDIWFYRAQICFRIKRQIYPPNGNPFCDIPTFMNLENSFDYFRLKLYTLLNRLINSSNNDDLRRMAALYILTALTIVSNDAAAALPWLFESTQ